MHESDNFDDERPKSKTRVKKEMLELQDLGKQLTEMNPSQLAEIPLDADLREAIDALHRIKSNEARRRQLQYIGKLMRSTDSEAIEEVLNRRKERDQMFLRFDRMAEEWRKRLLEEGAGAQQEFFDRYPNTDHQQLRQLVRDAGREIAHNKPPTYQRKLFRYLRDFLMQESQHE